VMSLLPEQRGDGIGSSESIELQVAKTDRYGFLLDNGDTHSYSQQGLLRVLKAYTEFQPEEGYCQAQGPVAAVLLMNMPLEEAFWCLVQISELYLPGYYSTLLEGVLFDAAILSSVLKRTCPAAHKHMESQGVEPLMFATDWLMCLYSRHLPFNTLLRVWDLFFCYGVRVLFQVAVVLVRRCLGEARQRKECEGQMETLEQLRAVRGRVQHEHADSFIQEVCSVPLSLDDLQKQTDKEFEKWRKERPGSTFDPRFRCHGYYMVWEKEREHEKEQNKKEKQSANLSVSLTRSHSSLSPTVIRKKWRKRGSKVETEEWEGSARRFSHGIKEESDEGERRRRSVCGTSGELRVGAGKKPQGLGGQFQKDCDTVMHACVIAVESGSSSELSNHNMPVFEEEKNDIADTAAPLQDASCKDHGQDKEMGLSSSLEEEVQTGQCQQEMEKETVTGQSVDSMMTHQDEDKEEKEMHIETDYQECISVLQDEHTNETQQLEESQTSQLEKETLATSSKCEEDIHANSRKPDEEKDIKSSIQEQENDIKNSTQEEELYNSKEGNETGNRRCEQEEEMDINRSKQEEAKKQNTSECKVVELQIKSTEEAAEVEVIINIEEEATQMNICKQEEEEINSNKQKEEIQMDTSKQEEEIEIYNKKQETQSDSNEQEEEQKKETEINTTEQEVEIQINSSKQEEMKAQSSNKEKKIQPICLIQQQDIPEEIQHQDSEERASNQPEEKTCTAQQSSEICTSEEQYLCLQSPEEGEREKQSLQMEEMVELQMCLSKKEVEGAQEEQAGKSELSEETEKEAHITDPPEESKGVSEAAVMVQEEKVEREREKEEKNSNDSTTGEDASQTVARSSSACTHMQKEREIEPSGTPEPLQDSADLLEECSPEAQRISEGVTPETQTGVCDHGKFVKNSGCGNPEPQQEAESVMPSEMQVENTPVLVQSTTQTSPPNHPCPGSTSNPHTHLRLRRSSSSNTSYPTILSEETFRDPHETEQQLASQHSNAQIPKANSACLSTEAPIPDSAQQKHTTEPDMSQDTCKSKMHALPGSAMQTPANKPKRKGLFHRFKGEAAPKSTVPKILIQDFSEGEEKLSSKERRRKRREQERRNKEEEKERKKREKELEKEKERERKTPQMRRKSFQRLSRKCDNNDMTPGNSGSQTSGSERNTASYANNYF
ncbi:hypothetical protein P4O66_020327, partial [Electrophorus voltai]